MELLDKSSTVPFSFSQKAFQSYLLKVQNIISHKGSQSKDELLILQAWYNTMLPGLQKCKWDLQKMPIFYILIP